VRLHSVTHELLKVISEKKNAKSYSAVQYFLLRSMCDFRNLTDIYLFIYLFIYCGQKPIAAKLIDKTDVTEMKQIVFACSSINMATLV
jgi:hypothetical protein